MFDAIVIGGGVAGLYAAHRLQASGARVVVLERSSTLGGRLVERPFGGTVVPTGAGIARKHKDVTLLRLASALRVPTTPFEIQHAYAPGIDGAGVVEDLLPRLRRAALPSSTRPTTFRAFALRALGRDRYRAFVRASGYTDFEGADARDTLQSYGLEDNADGWTGVAVPWNRLAAALARGVQVRLSSEVTRIAHHDGGGVQVFLRDRATPLWCRVVVVATDVFGLRALLPEFTAPLWSHILPQPFVRTYAVVARASRGIVAHAVPRFTVVPAPLQKVIPMDPSRGVYMIAYADNASAESVQRLNDDCRAFAALLADALSLPQAAVKLDKVKTFYWRAGTHAFAPLPRPFKTRAAFLHAAQHPAPRVFVAGEAVARRQGWVQGALESVDEVLGPALDLKPT